MELSKLKKDTLKAYSQPSTSLSLLKTFPVRISLDLGTIKYELIITPIIGDGLVSIKIL